MNIMTIIDISEDVKRDLLKVLLELQVKLNRKVDFNEAIRFLLMKERKKDPVLLKEALIQRSDAKEALDELLEERKRDDERAKRRLSC